MRQDERRAQTTAQLLDAAAEVFARRGFHAATLDDVAAAAGYTKGAVYSNFAGKEALFLALLDRHLDEQLAAIERLAAMDSGADLRAALEAATEEAAASGWFGLLTLEFWLYAARDERAEQALATRYRRIRDRLAELIAERGSPAVSPAEAAALLLALDAGLFLQQLIDPDAITPALRARAIADLLDPAPTSRTR